MDIKTNEGKIIDRHGEKIAVYKDESGKETTLSAVCTHKSCTVDWNSKEKTWDCPCHGSRFNPQGKVINGPAVTDLPHLYEHEIPIVVVNHDSGSPPSK